MRLDDIVSHARERYASDIHGVESGAIVFRYASKIEQAPKMIVSDALVAELLDNLTKRGRTVFGKRGGITETIKGSYGSVRLTLTKEQAGTRFHLRVLGLKPKGLAELNLPEAQLRKLLNRSGIILFVGPKGQGKTTATSACVEAILDDSRGRTIVKIERAIENSHDPRPNGAFVSHREIPEHSPTFADALADATQADVDVIVSGEINSRDSAVAALEALDNGALVLANMQTYDEVTALMRFTGWFAGNEQDEVRARFAEHLLGIFAIRLLPAKQPVAQGQPNQYPAVGMLLPKEGGPAIKNYLAKGQFQLLRDAMRVAPNRSLQQAAQELVEAKKVDARSVSLILNSDE